MHLKELQHAFLTAYYDAEQRDDFLQCIVKKEALDNEQRFNIYYDGITAGLARALSDTYPVCSRLVGEEFFLRMAYVYVEQTPSRSSNLNNYGASFSDFVQHFPPVTSLPYLADVCRLEWAYHNAYYAADHVVGDFAKLAELSEEEQGDIIFHLPSSASLCESAYPIDQIWQMAQEGSEHAQEIDASQGGVRLMVWRNGVDVRISKLSEDEWEMLSRMSYKMEFNQLVAEVTVFNPKADLLQLLPSLIKKKWVIGFSLG